MKPHFDCQLSWFETGQQKIRYRLYQNRYSNAGRRLLLLHGAGVAGADTWELIVKHLHGWHQVLVPDLRGMGETVEVDGVERHFKVEEVAEDQIELINDLGWWAFDMAGYSFGGLVSMLIKQRHPHRVYKQYLLESALIDREDIAQAIERRRLYSEVARQLRESSDSAAVESTVLQFLDLVSPGRVQSARGDAISIERLGARPLGFANALDSVTEACSRIDRQGLLASQGDVSCAVGGRTHELVHLYAQQLAKQRSDWHYLSLKGCDHSLPYQKPRQLARWMDQELERYLLSAG